MTTPNVSKDVGWPALTNIADEKQLADFFFINLNTFLWYHLAIPLLGTYPSKVKTYVHIKTH